MKLPASPWSRCAGGVVALIIGTVPLGAAITRLVVDATQPVGTTPAATAGNIPAAAVPLPALPFEVLTGRAFGELDPSDRRNAIITDLQYAPRNARGMVEYVTTFTLTKPVNLAQASGLLVYGVSNRGNRVLPDDFNYARGDVFLVSGWQGDVPATAQSIKVPVARQPDGSSITGVVLARFPLTQSTDRLELPGERLPVSHDPTKARLTKRIAEDTAIIPIAPSQWSFVDDRSITMKGGFEAGYVYELAYTAKDPLVLGVGLAATRDLVSFFHHSPADGTGAANPVAQRIRWVIAQGISQSGNFIKTFLHLGFNEDESGRIVWNGANPHIAARQTPLNFRFAIPGGATAPFEPGSEAVLWWSDYADTARQRPAAGMLDRARQTNTVPKIIETFGAAEFWGLRMSPNLVGTGASQDIPLPENVRRYYFPGTTHGGGRGGFMITPKSATNAYGLAANPNPQTETLRALRVALIEWVTQGTEPPPSRYPRLDRGELVPPDSAAMGFPLIPGVALPDHLMNPFYDYDFGPEFNHNDLSGVMRQPPIVRRIIPQLVPRVDGDGNEVGGVPSVLHQVPLGSYLGWAVTATGYYKDRQSGFAGSFIPFAATKSERLAAGDPRPSIEERYGSHEKYVALARAAAAQAVSERFLLPDDAKKLIQQAREGDILRAATASSTPVR